MNVLLYFMSIEGVQLVPANGSYCEDYECHSFFSGANWNYGKLIFFLVAQKQVLIFLD